MPPAINYILKADDSGSSVAKCRGKSTQFLRLMMLCFRTGRDRLYYT